jgi:SagB-type dehydrogenase family enzyme
MHGCGSTSQLTELWSLRHDTSMEIGAGGDVVLSTTYGELTLKEPAASVVEALRRMLHGPVSLCNVVPDFPGCGRPQPGQVPSAEAQNLMRAMEALQPVVVRSLARGGTLLLSAVPVSEQARFQPVGVPEDREHRLSRYALIRSAEDGMRMESPLSHYRVELHQPDVCVVVGRLGGAGRTRTDEPCGELTAPEIETVVGYLLTTGMAVAAERLAEPGRAAAFREDRDPELLSWSFEDLLVHTRSRTGMNDGSVGATFAFTDRLTPEPLIKPPSGGTVIPLYRPELATLLANDPPFTAVLEERRSIRTYGTSELALGPLGELLFRAARMRSAGAGPDPDPPAADSADSAAPAVHAAGSRPYPSTGGTYALELYVVASRCEGLAPGVYHYDPLGHTLEAVEGDLTAAAEMLESARVWAGQAVPPPVLFAITARYRRMAFQYSGIAYTSLLKDVGVLQQTLYLVCTAMGLAPCALAVGDIAAPERALGVGWLAEPCVGEFLVGAAG